MQVRGGNLKKESSTNQTHKSDILHTVMEWGVLPVYNGGRAKGEEENEQFAVETSNNCDILCVTDPEAIPSHPKKQQGNIEIREVPPVPKGVSTKENRGGSQEAQQSLNHKGRVGTKSDGSG